MVEMENSQTTTEGEAEELDSAVVESAVDESSPLDVTEEPEDQEAVEEIEADAGVEEEAESTAEEAAEVEGVVVEAAAAVVEEEAESTAEEAAEVEGVVVEAEAAVVEEEAESTAEEAAEVEGVVAEAETAVVEEELEPAAEETAEVEDMAVEAEAVHEEEEEEAAEEVVADAVAEVDEAVIEAEADVVSEGLEEIELEDVVPASEGIDGSESSEVQAEVVEGEPDDGRHWYVVHCYSGYENKVRHNLEQRIETMGMKSKIFDVVVPTEEEIEVKDGKRRTVERRVFPGYILVQMILTEESWYVVRNTPGVTGFVGMGNEPTPLRPEEVASIVKRMEAEAPRIKVTYSLGQKVRIIDGPFNDFIGTVDDIDMERAKVRVMVSFFGRETPVELDFLQVEKA